MNDPRDFEGSFRVDEVERKTLDLRFSGDVECGPSSPLVRPSKAAREKDN